MPPATWNDYCDKEPSDLLFARFSRPAKEEQADQKEGENSQAKFTRERCEDLALLLPVLEDANSIQIALMKVMRLLLANAIPSKTAGLLVYALQTASANLARTNFQPPGEQVITVPFTVPVHGPYERSNKNDPVDNCQMAGAESDQSKRVPDEPPKRARKNSQLRADSGAYVLTSQSHPESRH